MTTARQDMEFVTARVTTQNTAGRTNDGNYKRNGDASWRSKGRLQRVDPRETRHDVSPGTNLFHGGMRDDPLSLQPEPKLFGSSEHIEAVSDQPLSLPTRATLRRITIRATPLSLMQAAGSPPERGVVDIGIDRHPMGPCHRQSPKERKRQIKLEIVLLCRSGDAVIGAGGQAMRARAFARLRGELPWTMPA
jgi:hypothetical protein